MFAKKTAAGNNSKQVASKVSVPRRWLRILYWGLVLSGIYFAYLNIQPYEQAIRFLGAKAANESFVYLVSVVPIVNGIANFIGRGVNWILGALLWLTIQIIEVLPMILYTNDDFVRQVITDADKRTKYEPVLNDDPTLAMLKRTYNNLPISLVSNLEQLKIVTYVIDFLICVTVYSPVESGRFGDFFWIVVSGQWNKIDYGNLALALTTLFAVEIILGLILWVGKLSYALNSDNK